MIKVLIADDQALIRESLQIILSAHADIEVVGTVRNYLSGILAKLNLRDRTQLAIWAVQTGVTQRDFSKESDK